MKGYIIGAMLLAPYIAGASLPMESLWFDPGVPSFADTPVGSDPQLTFVRTIKIKTGISYALILRDALHNDVVCDAIGGPFDYLPEKSGAMVGKGLAWFAPSDPRCKALPVGIYYGQVTWTASYPLRAFLPDILDGPLGWIIPPKSVTREIPPFKILEKAP